MEILLWLAPAGVVAVLAMLWVAWWGREGRGEVDHDEALRRLGTALDRPLPDRIRRGPRPGAPADPTRGGAVRRTGPAPLRAAPGSPAAAPAPASDPAPRRDPGEPPARQVS